MSGTPGLIWSGHAATERVFGRESDTWGGDRAVQLVLPALRQLMRGDEGRFAHAAEREFSRLLSFYRLRWSYEPTSFVLRRDSHGRVLEAFHPDFYLPDRDLYIELTTMRQALVTRKNRKLRLLRELYPNVTVRLLYRRDVQRLAAAYHPAARAVRISPGDVVASPDELDCSIRLLADSLHEEWLGPGEPGEQAAVLLGTGDGARGFQQRLLNLLGRSNDVVDGGMILVSRFRMDHPDRTARLIRAPRLDIAGRRVLLATDVISTGLSLQFVIEWLRRQGAADIRVCALLDRRVARLVDVPVCQTGFTAPDAQLAGFGLQMHPQYESLPYITAVRAEHQPEL